MHGEPATGGTIGPATMPLVGEAGCTLAWSAPAPSMLTVNITGAPVSEQQILAALRAAVLDCQGRNGQAERP